MIREQQKNMESLFAREAAQLMGVQWELEPRQEQDGGPDFIVREGAHRFGLEVMEVFAGLMTGQKGSSERRRQSETQKIVDRIRRLFEDSEKGIALYVKFLCPGPLRDCHIEQVISALRSMHLRNKEPLYCEERVVTSDPVRLKIFVTRLPNGWPRDQLSRPDWFSVSDTVGWVERNAEKIRGEIESKSNKLIQYRKNVESELGVGSSKDVDVRLLLVANQMWSYGQVAIDELRIGSSYGFDRVYFFPFPEHPIVL